MFTHVVELIYSNHLQYRPNGLAVIIRRHMDNARFALADGFLTVYPSFFRADEVLNAFDKTNTSVEWPGFQNAIA